VPRTVAATSDDPKNEERKRAALYLRVSTVGQVNTDRDGEGFSLAAQRDVCTRKAEMLGADVVDVYTDAGESARKADRPQLQEMLQRLRTERDIDYVVVHKLDRLARNRGDDVAITAAIQAAGAKLVSVTENIDETPSGILLHGIMSSIAEFYSQNLATEIIKGTKKKVEKGAFPGLAPIGYLNKQDLAGGNELRWIETDPERAPLICWAFQAYASGDYTLRQLTEALEDRGLTSRPTPKRPSDPLRLTAVAKILANRFYLGLFKWGGTEYQGTHESLVSIETFATVQAIMASRRRSGEKSRTHPHYLKGTIVCGRCGSRMIFSRNRGKLGTLYDYFVCIGRHTKRNSCRLPHIPVANIEDELAAYYDHVQLEPALTLRIRDHVLEFARFRQESSGAIASRERQKIQKLEAERRKLLKAYFADAVPEELLKEEQGRITKELADAGAALANSEIRWEVLEKNINATLGLVARLGTAYRKASPKTRKLFNQAVFEKVAVDLEGRVTEVKLAEPFATLSDEGLLAQLGGSRRKNPDAYFRGRGSNDALLVETMGLEPTTPCLQSRCSSD
jgi:site-specific DNA recombinase